jgi:hypothetical protein
MSQGETRTKRARAKVAGSAAKPVRNSETTATIASGTDTFTGRVSQLVSSSSEALGWLKKVVGIGYEWFSQTVTKVGLVALFFVVLWLPLGVLLDWPEFAFLGAVSGLILLVAIPFLIGGNDYEIGFELPDDHLVAGELANAPISVTNTNNHLQLPGVLELRIGEGIEEFAIPLLRAGETKNIAFEVPPQKRGKIQLGPMTTVKTDPVATLRRENQLLEKKEVYVYPKTVQLPPSREGILRDLEGDPTVSIVDSDMSFHSVREYVLGDNPKHIHWKLSAKMTNPGQFLLRQYEESRRSKMLVILGTNPNEYGNESDEFELAVSAAASLGLMAIRDKRKVSVLASDKVPKIAQSSVSLIKEFEVQNRKRLLENLSEVQLSELALPLLKVCQVAKKKHPDASLVVIVCGSPMTPMGMKEIEYALPKNIGILFVVTNTAPTASPRFSQIQNMKSYTIQAIQDLGGLMGRGR